jgi:hypothetical protein
MFRALFDGHSQHVLLYMMNNSKEAAQSPGLRGEYQVFVSVDSEPAHVVAYFRTLLV